MSHIDSIRPLAESRFLTLYELDAVRRDGGHFAYYMASRTADANKLKAVTHENKPDGVIVYATYEDKVVLVRQYRYPVGGYVYEFPAGLVEPGEDVVTAAKREMNSGVSISGSRLPRRTRSMPGTVSIFSRMSKRHEPLSLP